MSKSASPIARSKIVSVAELAEIAGKARAKGAKTVLAHGVFDLLHLGHVRHLEAARKEGDLLLVTCTADRFVNKGPGRPVFNEHLRAEMLAAIGCVGWVAINDDPSAEKLLNQVKPDIYVKGSDYEKAEDDVTGKIKKEQDAVEAHGGRIVFTRDMTLSSSNLINRYLDIYEPELRAYLAEMRQGKKAKTIADAVESLANIDVLLVGETIIDEYMYVETLGKAPKENIIASRYQSSEMFAGGVIATANHVAGLCRQVTVVTLLGRDDAHQAEAFLKTHLRPNVRLVTLKRPGPTVRKRRYVVPDYTRKLFEVQYFDDRPLSPAIVRQLCAAIAKYAPKSQLTMVNDFGHGMLGSEAIAELRASSRFLAVNAQSNSANLGFNLITKYPKADFICIDTIEARLACCDRHTPIEQLATRDLPRLIGCKRIVLTLGSEGCCLSGKKDKPLSIPAFTKTVRDTMGAGDAFFAVTSPLAAMGCSLETIGFVGNAAGAIKVGIVGHRQSIEKAQLLKYIATLLR